MTKNPIVNALAAMAYIVCIVALISFLPHIFGEQEFPFAPILMLSLFTLSAAMMAYIFLLQPFELYFQGQKKEAVSLFLKTMGIFGSLIVLLLIITSFLS